MRNPPSVFSDQRTALRFSIKNQTHGSLSRVARGDRQAVGLLLKHDPADADAVAEFRRTSIEGLLLFLRVGSDRVQHPLFFGELTRLELGIDQIPVDRNFEATSARRNQLQIAYLLLVGGQQLARQTDGLRFIVSNRTILELQVHDQLLLVPGKCAKVKAEL